MQRYFLLCFNNHIFTVNFASVQQFIGTFKKNIIDFTAITFDNSERHRNVNIVIFINKIFIFDYPKYRKSTPCTREFRRKEAENLWKT